MNPSSPAVTPLRQRMLDDMRMRKLEPKTQTSYVRAVRKLAGFLARSPDPQHFIAMCYLIAGHLKHLRHHPSSAAIMRERALRSTRNGREPLETPQSCTPKSPGHFSLPFEKYLN